MAQPPVFTKTSEQVQRLEISAIRNKCKEFIHRHTNLSMSSNEFYGFLQFAIGALQKPIYFSRKQEYSETNVLIKDILLYILPIGF